jgi:hypothetical protein
MSLPVNSEWLIERHGANDQIIRVTDSNPFNFSSVFVGIDNSSDFAAFDIGSRQGERDEYVGAWGDVANGFSGRFRLVRRL